jgi:hypothetical protein
MRQDTFHSNQQNVKWSLEFYFNSNPWIQFRLIFAFSLLSLMSSDEFYLPTDTFVTTCQILHSAKVFVHKVWLKQSFLGSVGAQ